MGCSYSTHVEHNFRELEKSRGHFGDLGIDGGLY